MSCKSRAPKSKSLISRACTKFGGGGGGGCIFSFLSRLAEKLGGDELTGVLNENFVGTLEGERSRKKTKEKLRLTLLL